MEDKLPRFPGWHLGQVGHEPTPMIHYIHDFIQAQPLHFCVGLGVFLFIVLAYIFHLADVDHIQNNPEVQWHLKQIKAEEAEFEEETKEMWEADRRARRIKRRKRISDEKKEKFAALSKEDQNRIIEKMQARHEKKWQEEEILY